MIIHTISPGETFYSIATKYGISVARLLKDNGISNPDTPVVGQALLIRRPLEYYTVRSGDTLGSIAANNGTTLKILYQNNPELIDSTLFPGQQIVLSYDSPPSLGDLFTNGYAYPFISPEIQKKSLPYLTDFTVFTYGFDQEGNLIAPEPDDLPVVEIARSFGASPVLLLSTLGPDGTFNSRLAGMLFDSPAATDNLISQLLAVMAKKGYRGIDVDFEYILPEDADNYVSFISLLRQRMNAAGFEVMVALAPKVSANQPGLLYEGHDYRGLGQSADAVLLMTYEWGYAFGPPGAIAPIGKVEEVINYALTEIPADKIFLGIPNYGYDWTLPFTPGQGRAKTISPGQAVELAAKYRTEILFDPQTASPYFYYTAEDGKRHAVHFEDVRSFDRKFKLLAEKGLSGFSVWTVMNDTPALFLLANELFNIL